MSTEKKPNGLARIATIVGVVVGGLGILGSLYGFSENRIKEIAKAEIAPVEKKAENAKKDLDSYKELDQKTTEEFRKSMDKGLEAIQKQLDRMDRKLDQIEQRGR